MKYLDLIDLLEGDTTTAEIEKLTAQLDADRPALAAAEAHCQQSEQAERDHGRLFNAAQERRSALAAQVAEMQSTVFDSAMRDRLSDNDLAKFSTLNDRFTCLSEATERFRTYELRNAHREMLIARITHLNLTEDHLFARHAIEILSTVGLLKDVAQETGGLNISEQNISTPRSDELLNLAFNAGSDKTNLERELQRFDEESARLRN